ncbi:facilitated trehalose transporter Tret1-like isoform X5 [Leptidea sinapis]|uniref:facilitated trehalose transporter Tret1-like isoform X5 n=1 Tax=Leptidea sinapis TaxID=189913 RepID=UPI0021307B08|nr:facilitated trehalose transporter Tret1-like isoform X5 [Leptidea sinapis]
MSCFNDILYWRQSLILISMGLHSMGIGFLLSFPAALNAALLSTNTTDITATPDQVSSLTASYGLFGMVGFIFMPSLMQSRGRKLTHIILNVLIILGFFLTYLAKNITMLFIGRTLQGLVATGVTLTTIILAEYCHPKRRGYFLATMGLWMCVGSLICHALSAFWNWRNIAALAMLPLVIALILTFIWPESPSFLAMKRKFVECDQSHTWLFGDSKESKDMLNALISAQSEEISDGRNVYWKNIKDIVTAFGKGYFLRPLSVVIVLTLMVDASGRYFMLVYLSEIFVEITGDASIAFYCSLGVDVTIMISSLLFIVIIRLFNRKTILFVTGFCTTILLYVVSFTVHLKSTDNDSVWLTPGLIILSTFVSNSGLVPIAFIIIGEIFPLEHRGLGGSLGGIVFTGLYGVTMKCIPILLEHIGTQGVFAVLGTCMLVCLVILIFILNETKDKTLQEIEDELKGIKRTKIVLISEDVLAD